MIVGIVQGRDPLLRRGHGESGEPEAPSKGEPLQVRPCLALRARRIVLMSSESSQRKCGPPVSSVGRSLPVGPL